MFAYYRIINICSFPIYSMNSWKKKPTLQTLHRVGWIVQHRQCEQLLPRGVSIGKHSIVHLEFVANIQVFQRTRTSRQPSQFAQNLIGSIVRISVQRNHISLQTYKERTTWQLLDLPLVSEIRPHACHTFHLKVFRIGYLEHWRYRWRHKQVQQVIVVNRTCGSDGFHTFIILIMYTLESVRVVWRRSCGSLWYS